MTPRIDVYSVINGERDYQDSKYPRPVDGFSASPEGFLLVIEELVSQARASVTQGKLPPLGDGSEIMNFMRKIAATAVRAQEQHGIVRRQGY